LRGRIISTSIAGWALLGLLLVAPVIAAPNPDSATLFIYLEVPADYSIPTELAVANLHLSGETAPVDVAPLRRRLVAGDLAGKQVLLARTTLAAGYYDTLFVELGAVVAQAGMATVEPPVRTGGYAVDLDINLQRGEAAVVNLVWQPGPAPADGKPYHLAIHTERRPVPPLGSVAFVTERESGSVLVVDWLAGRVSGAVKVGEDPRSLVYSDRTQKLYVAMAGEDGIGVVDGMTLRLERVVPLSFGDDPDRLALSPDEATLYVLNTGSRSLVGLATRSMQEQYRTAVGNGPRSLAVDPDNGRIYVACEDEGEVQVFNPAGLTRLTSLMMTAAPVEVVVAESSRDLFAGSSSQNRIHGLNLEEGGEPVSQSLCGPAHYLAYNPRSRQLFAAIPSCREIAVLGPAEGLEFSPLSLEWAPGRLAFDSGHRKLFVIFTRKATLGIYDANRRSLESLVELGGLPHAVVVP